jgi:hypothetical protein
MINIKMITMGHCKWETWEKSVKQLYATKSLETIIEHYFIYHYYPINEENNKKKLREIAKDYGLIWLDPGKNLGNTVGHNWAQDNHIKAQDFLFGYDPDACPLNNGWDLAMYQVISNPKIGWCSLSCDATENEIKDRAKHVKEETINGIDCYLCDTPMMLSTGVLKQDIVRAAGGMLPKENLYGGTEIFMWQYLKSRGYELALLKDYKDTALEIKNPTTDPIYHLWKARHCQGYEHNFDIFIRDLGFNKGQNQELNTWEYFTKFMKGDVQSPI